MSDFTINTTGEERDQVSELPLGPSHIDSPTNPNQSPKSQHTHLHGNHSNVSLDFFDPAGVNRLGRTLSQMSGTQQRSAHSVASSNDTVVGDKFDLEKTLRAALQQ
jgi:hypothetical protein